MCDATINVPRASPSATQGRRAFLASSLVSTVLLTSRSARAEGITNTQAEGLVSIVGNDEETSDLVKRLLESSAQNKEKNKKAVIDKYCLRQAEDGVGDCAGLRLIPGATKSGKQVTPGWLKSLLRIEDKDD